MAYVYWDIETRANEKAREYYELFWQPPANVTKAETIAAKRAEQIATLDGAGLHWWTGAVCCICARCGDLKFSLCTSDERILLCEFFAWCNALENQEDVTYLGKNGLDFDAPFIKGRAMALSIKMPYKLSGKADLMPLRDIDHIFGKFARNSQHGKLSAYAWGLGLTGKSSSGDQVQGMFDKEKFDDIRTYCEDDVRLVAEIHQRWKEVTE